MNSNGFWFVVVFSLVLVTCGISTSIHAYSLNDPPLIATSPGNPPEQQSEIVYYTKNGYLAATSEKLLNRVVALAVSGHQEKFRKFVNANPSVFPLKGGVKVFIEQTSWPGKVKIRPYNTNITIWTVREAIE